MSKDNENRTDDKNVPLDPTQAKEQQFRIDTMDQINSLIDAVIEEKKAKGEEVQVGMYRKVREITWKCIEQDVPNVDLDYFLTNLDSKHIEDIKEELEIFLEDTIVHRRDLDRRARERAKKLEKARAKQTARNTFVSISNAKKYGIALIAITVICMSAVFVYTAFNANRVHDLFVQKPVPVTIVQSQPAPQVQQQPVVKQPVIQQPEVTQPVVVVPKTVQDQIGAKLPTWCGPDDYLEVVSVSTIVTDNFTDGITTAIVNDLHRDITFTVKIVRGEVYRIYVTNN